MGDRTHGAVTVFACPPEKVNIVTNAIEEFICETKGVLHLGETYSYEEVNLGTVDDLSSVLLDKVPECVFIMSEDPKYEFLGTLGIYTPELGWFSADCDADGNPVFNSRAIMDMVNTSTLTPEALGIPWLDAVHELREAVDHNNYVALPRHDVDWYPTGPLCEEDPDNEGLCAYHRTHHGVGDDHS